ncbi:MAG: undecaprenyl-phosphate glucose phosphotransferase [Pseudomonadota bacterium]
MVPYSEAVIIAAVFTVDFLILILTGAASFVVILGVENALLSQHFSACVMISIGIVVSNFLWKLDSFNAISRPVGFVWRQVLSVGVVFLLFTAVAFFLKISDQFSRLWLLSWFASSLVLFGVHRIVWFFLLHWLARHGRFVRRIVLIGGGAEADHFLDGLDYESEPWNRVIGVFDDRIQREGFERRLQSKKWGKVDDVIEFCRRNRVDDIVITLPWTANKRIGEIIEKLMELPINIRLGSNLENFIYSTPTNSAIGNVKTLDIVFHPLDGWRYALKLAEDKILAFILIILLSPILLIVAILIRLDSPGPALFRQPRHGFNNKEFFVYKFRTMKEGAAPVSGEDQTLRDDPRITRIGAFLRSTSIDELPQILNVLQGTMSLIGPRPHPVPLGDEFAPVVTRYFARHRVRPGITGWAQVNGLRGAVWEEADMRKRVDHDLYYIDNWSIGLDIKILVMTAFRGIVGENAY